MVPLLSVEPFTFPSDHQARNKRGAGGTSPPFKIFAPLETFVGHRLKNLGLSQKTLRSVFRLVHRHVFHPLWFLLCCLLLLCLKFKLLHFITLFFLFTGKVFN